MNYYSRLSTKGYQTPSYWHSPGKESLAYMTIGQLVDWAAEQYGDREALVSLYQHTRWTFKQVREKADELAAGLLSLGLVPGDMNALWGYNSSYHYLTSIAAARAGLITAKVDPSYLVPELLQCLRKVGAKLLVAVETDQSQDCYQIVRSLAPEVDSCAPGKLRSEQLPQLTTLVLTGDQPRPGSFQLDDVFKMATTEGIRRIHELQQSFEPDKFAFIHYTSGTTGTPKAAAWTHHAAVNASKAYKLYVNPHSKPWKTLVQMQCCHIAASLFAVLTGFHSGSTTVFAAPEFHLDSSIEALVKEKCEIVFGTPTMYVDLITEVQENGISLTCPKMSFIAGTTISEVLARQIVDVLPLEKFMPLYGMTEFAPIFLSGNESMETSIQAVGTTTDYIEVKVVDKEGKVVPMGTPGELWVRGYCMMKCYWNDEEKTREMISEDGWLKTGDQVILQSDGCGKVVGRIKDAIIRGSDHIFPKEVEEFFLTHPAVLDALAFGVPDARWTEEVCVYIRPREGCSLDESQMKSFCKGKVADFRIPRYVRFAEKFPQNLIGKIDRKKMREEFLQDKEYLENNRNVMKRLLGRTAK